MDYAFVEIEYFYDDNAKCPFKEWFEEIGDVKIQRAIDHRLLRIRRGNFWDSKFIGSGVFELRFFIGPGYRIYFSRNNRQQVILLCGGTKRRQSIDIKKAQNLWQEYLRRKN